MQWVLLGVCSEGCLSIPPLSLRLNSTKTTDPNRENNSFTSAGLIKIRNAKYALDKSNLDKNCDCVICKNYSKAYLHHLVKSSEILGSVFLTQHNLYYYKVLMQRIRRAIFKGNLDKLKL